MLGTILIVDGVATNRIMLKVLLSAAYYHVVQTDGLADIEAMVRRTRPDLIVTAMSLPDGSAIDLKSRIDAEGMADHIPILAITPQNDRAARLRALRAGIDDVLCHPLDDLILQARIRSLMRVRSTAEELQGRLDDNGPTLGFAEPGAPFAAFLPAEPAMPEQQAKVAIVSERPATGTLWASGLVQHGLNRLTTCQTDDIQCLLREPVPDAIVIEVPAKSPAAGLRLLADLSARGATRNSALIAVTERGHPQLAAEALDRGAHDVMQSGFCPDELSLRLECQLRRKLRADRMRDSLRNGLRAAIVDPMTGLYNRRFALPQLARIAGQSAERRQSFAVMLVDLDHFKQINDRYGHSMGDAVLTEAAQRMKGLLGEDDLIARVGGEEFLIALPASTEHSAREMANCVCRAIAEQPFASRGLGPAVRVTASIGVAVGAPTDALDHDTSPAFVKDLIDRADTALYEAKHGGRNQVALMDTAA